MKSARTFNGLSTQIFLWFWFILLLVVAFRREASGCI